MIKNFKLKFGRAAGLPGETIQATPVTVFVGPNNSGKSKVLQEMFAFCCNGQRNLSDVILESIEFEKYSQDLAEGLVQRITVKPDPRQILQPGHVCVGGIKAKGVVQKVDMLNSMADPNHPNQTPMFCSWFLRHLTLMLDGTNRIMLINERDSGDLQTSPVNNLQMLFGNDEKRKQVRRILHDAFSSFFVVDPTKIGKLRVRLSEKEPSSDMEERGIHKEAVEFHSKALPIEQASDGVKAFTGIMTEIIAGDPAVMMIDEPEAFLHPALAYKLGHEIARASRASDKHVFVSTHSPNFVMGCIQSGAPVNIIRLTYRGHVATARILPKEELLKLMRNPLLRSTGVLNGLFSEFVVVTEGDADRAFYQEINERLLLYRPEMGVPNCLFLNAQNKQTVHTIIRPLRNLGIPAAGVVDIDTVKHIFDSSISELP